MCGSRERVTQGSDKPAFRLVFSIVGRERSHAWRASLRVDPEAMAADRLFPTSVLRSAECASRAKQCVFLYKLRNTMTGRLVTE